MITKNYIKMCEKNEDLQKAWKPKERDYCKTLISCPAKMAFIENIMIDIDNNIIYTIKFLDKKLYTRWESVYQSDLKNEYFWLPTQEQLLAFVMKEKYNKVWKGKAWIKI